MVWSRWRSAVIVSCACLLAAGCDLLVSPEVRLERARGHVAEAEYRAAMIELKNALAAQPEFHEARVLLAEVALWLGDATSARIELDKADPQCERSAAAELCVRIDLALRRYDAALARLRADSSIPPAARHVYEGMAHAAMGRHEQAAASFRAALALDPGSLAAELGLVESMATRELPAALERSAGIVAAHPDSALAWYTRGALLARAGESAAAADAFEHAQARIGQLDVPQQAALFAAQAETHFVLGDLAGARAAIGALQNVAPGTPVAKLLSARLHMAEGRYSEASAELHRALQTAPELTQARFMLAIALVAQGHLEQASQRLAEVLAETPANVEARQLLAQVRLRLSDPNGALQTLIPALRADADDGRLVALMDELTASGGIGATGIELLEKAFAQDRDNERLALQLASAHLRNGSPERAVELLRAAPAGAADGRREALLVEALVKSQGTAAARAQVDALLRERPGDAATVSLAASFYAGTGELDAGRRLLERALQQSPNEPLLLTTLARLEWRAGHVARARDALQRVLHQDAGNAAARMALARLELRTGNATRAGELLEPLRADPTAAEPRLLLARIALMNDDVQRTKQLVDEALDSGAHRADLHNAAGSMYLNAARYDLALEHFLTATRLAPDVPLLWLNLGRTQLGLGQGAAARSSLDKALELQPGWIAAEGVMAFLELQEGHTGAALARMARLKDANPRDAAVHALDGDINLSLQRYVDAARAFETALDLRPARELAVKAYHARTASGQGDADLPLRRWLAGQPDDHEIRKLLAQALIAGGDRRAAIAEYERILAAMPDDAITLNNLAWQYFEAKDARALTLARKAHALAPEEIAIIDTLGWILVDAGHLEEGLKRLRDAANRSGAPPDVGFHYAFALARSGAQREAVQRLQALLAKHASFPSREAAQRLLEELEQPDEGG